MSDETPRAARRGRTRARGSKPRQRARQPTATTILEADLEPDEPAPLGPDPNDCPAFTWEPALDPRPRHHADPWPPGKVHEALRSYPEDNAPPSPPAPVSGAARYPGPVASYVAQIPDVRDWLHRCYSWGIVHGAQLVMALGSPNHHKKTGQADNVATADRILMRLEEEKWIIRRAYEPTREQLFFGVGGREPGKRAAKGCGHAIEHCWEVNEEHEELRTFLELKPRPAPESPKPAPTPKADTEEPFWKRMGYKRNPNDAPITGYCFSQCSDLSCAECYRTRSREGYHPDLAGMGHSIPLLRFRSKTPQVSGSCKWCGATIEGESGFLAWLKGEVS